jgi:hypothetical protein
MTLPEDVHRRLALRAVTDLDVASLLAIFTRPAETASEPPPDEGIEMSKRPSSDGNPLTFPLSEQP